MEEFNGDRSKFPKFQSMFNAEVHSRTDLSDVTKLIYLLSLLKGEPLKRVENYEITPHNYAVVKGLIEEEYGKKELIINAHLKKLFQLMSTTPATSDAAFNAFYIEASSQARALKALGHNEENIRDTMMTLLPEKMPEDMRILWFRQINGKDLNTLTLQQLYDFIGLEMSVRARFKTTGLENHQNRLQQHRPESHHSTGYRHPKTATLAALHVSSKHHSEVVPPCLFCGSTTHKSGLCHKNIEERKKVFSNQMLCFKCARKGHAAATCKKSCAHCSEEHHIYICEAMAKMAAERSNSTAAISTSPNTILQTLCVEAIGPKGKSKLRVFLDGGSSFTYITQKAAEELGLQSLTEHHAVSVFGGRASWSFHGEDIGKS